MKIDYIYIILIILSFILKKFIGGPIFVISFYTVLFILFIAFFYIMYFKKYITAEIISDDTEFRVFKNYNFKIKIMNKGLLFAPFVEIINKDGSIDLFGVRKKDKVYYNIDKFFIKRGIYKKEEFKILFKDPFNIFTFSKNVNIDEITVYPIRYEKLNSFKVNKNISKIGFLKNYNNFDIQNIRKYNIGDNFRKINWNIFAKTGDMYITESNEENLESTLLVIDMNKENNLYKYSNINIDKRDRFNIENNINIENKMKINLEEYLIGFAISLSNYFLKNNLYHKVEINNNNFESLDIKKESNIKKLEEYMSKNPSLATTSLNEYLYNRNTIFNSYKFIFLVTFDLKTLDINMISKIYKNSSIIIFVLKVDYKEKEKIPKNILIYDIGEIINEN